VSEIELYCRSRSSTRRVTRSCSSMSREMRMHPGRRRLHPQRSKSWNISFIMVWKWLLLVRPKTNQGSNSPRFGAEWASTHHLLHADNCTPPDIQLGEVMCTRSRLMRSEMSGSGYAFFTVFAFDADRPGPVEDSRPSFNEEYRAAIETWRDGIRTRC